MQYIHIHNIYMLSFFFFLLFFLIFSKQLLIYWSPPFHRFSTHWYGYISYYSLQYFSAADVYIGRCIMLLISRQLIALSSLFHAWKLKCSFYLGMRSNIAFIDSVKIPCKLSSLNLCQCLFSFILYLFTFRILIDDRSDVFYLNINIKTNATCTYKSERPPQKKCLTSIRWNKVVPQFFFSRYIIFVIKEIYYRRKWWRFLDHSLSTFFWCMSQF